MAAFNRIPWPQSSESADETHKALEKEPRGVLGVLGTNPLGKPFASLAAQGLGVGFEKAFPETTDAKARRGSSVWPLAPCPIFLWPPNRPKGRGGKGAGCTVTSEQRFHTQDLPRASRAVPGHSRRLVSFSRSQKCQSPCGPAG